uniref:Plant heme peroxidase family profile domain-containing protein n=1 Tax=Noctiluca scintillans TaxID=2966 RepID=A0A7S1A9G7_NOCSC
MVDLWRGLFLLFLFAPPCVSGDQLCNADCAVEPSLVEPSLFQRTLNRAITTNTTEEGVSERQSVAQLFHCSHGAAKRTTCMTTHTHTRIVTGVRELWSLLSPLCDEVGCSQAEWAGCILRMVGHDSMDLVSGQGGGADACLDLSDPINRGLERCLVQGVEGVTLMELYEEHCASVSLADFLVIAAETVMTAARELVLLHSPHRKPLTLSPFRFGRTTLEVCEFSRGRLPDPEGDCSDVERVLIGAMGLNWANVVAVLGLHTFGRADVQDSGYDGWWTEPTRSRELNNDYAISMVTHGWRAQVGVHDNPGRNQWEIAGEFAPTTKQGHRMMLNTDLCLSYQEDDDGTTPLHAATSQCCAWVAPTLLGEAVKQSGVYCGTPAAKLDFAAEHRKDCCGYNFTGARQDDCGSSFDALGPAYPYVESQANEEEKFLLQLAHGWEASTTKGITGLKPLDGCAGATP